MRNISDPSLIEGKHMLQHTSQVTTCERMKNAQFVHLPTRSRVQDRLRRQVGLTLTSTRRTLKPKMTPIMLLLSVRGSASTNERRRRSGRIKYATSKNSPKFTMKTKLIVMMLSRRQIINIEQAQIRINRSKRRLRRITQCLTNKKMKMVTLKTSMSSQSLKKNQMRATTPKMKI